MKANSYLNVDLAAVAENVSEIQKTIGEKCSLIPVLKGDAYGLGGVRLARFLSQCDGIDTFAVSHVAEGIVFRESGIQQKIMVMSLPLDWQVEDAVQNDLILTLGSFRQFAVLRQVSEKLGRKVKVQIKLDSGLHRIGFQPEELDRLCAMLKEASSYLEIVGTFSHFSCDEENLMEVQNACFASGLEKLEKEGIEVGIRHISSSGSLEVSKAYCYDAVRIGRALTLDSPVSPTGKIREAVSFRAYLTDIRDRVAGDTLAYGGKVRLEEDTKVGVLSIGYGDGLDPALSRVHAPVLVGGKRARLLASCMDQSFLDLNGIEASPGDEVTIFGYDAEGNFLSAQEVAALLGSEGCDLTTELTQRVERIYQE
ncbi:MAG: alanine racemase [Oscillospiraceae bacterium]|nr:alanine racemase [Oscillospiraceae bacterium]